MKIVENQNQVTIKSFKTKLKQTFPTLRVLGSDQDTATHQAKSFFSPNFFRFFVTDICLMFFGLLLCIPSPFTHLCDFQVIWPLYFLTICRNQVNLFSLTFCVILKKRCQTYATNTQQTPFSSFNFSDIIRQLLRNVKQTQN